MEVLENETLSDNLASQMSTVITMRNVGKVYKKSTIALQNVNLEVREGEFVSFVGPSGCGKSTVLQMVSGLGRPTSGTVEVLGTTPEVARKNNGEVAYVFQDATLLPWRTVMDNVVLPLELKGVPKKEQREEALRVLELVGLTEYTQALPNQLSGGMKMRVSIARALIANPKLLLMDEPFGALDEITRQNLQNELLSIWDKEGLTVLFVTHNVFESVFLSNRVAVMTPRPGKISAMVDIPLKYPRDEEIRSSQTFGELVSTVSKELKH